MLTGQIRPVNIALPKPQKSLFDDQFQPPPELTNPTSDSLGTGSRRKVASCRNELNFQRQGSVLLTRHRAIGPSVADWAYCLTCCDQGHARQRHHYAHPLPPTELIVIEYHGQDGRHSWEH